MKVRLDFLPPIEDNIVALHIYESATQTGLFTEIENVPVIGAYPDYISSYVTNYAASIDNWFRIGWEDDDGFIFPMSEAIRGDTRTPVGEVTSRVMLRDPGIDENVAAQEAEAVVADVFNADPYEVLWEDVTYQQWSGMTLLTMARCYMTDVFTGTEVSYTAGIVAQKVGTTTKSFDNIQHLIDQANEFLGLNYSLVMQMEEVLVAGASVVVPVDGVNIMEGIVRGQQYAEVFTADGASMQYQITHGLNTEDVVVQVWDNQTGQVVETEIVKNTDNQLTLAFGSPPDQGKEFRVVMVR